MMIKLQGANVDVENKSIRISWNITDTCNYTCWYCCNKSKQSPYKINNNDIKNLIKNLLNLNKYYYKFIISGGEPLLVSNLLYICSVLKDTFVCDIKIITNGSSNIEYYKALLDLGCYLDISIHPHEYYNLEEFNNYDNISLNLMIDATNFASVMKHHEKLKIMTNCGYNLNFIRNPPLFKTLVIYTKYQLDWYNDNIGYIRQEYLPDNKDVLWHFKDNIIGNLNYSELINNNNKLIKFKNMRCLQYYNTLNINCYGYYKGSICASCDISPKSLYKELVNINPYIQICKEDFCNCTANQRILKANNLSYIGNIC